MEIEMFNKSTDLEEKNINTELIDHIRKAISPQATDEEFKTFIYLCKSYGLDPLKKEIFFMKYGNKPATFITSRDGYLKIANQHGAFNGMESDCVYEGDSLTKRPDGSLLIVYGLEHMAFNKSKLLGAFCNIFRSDRDMAISVFVSIKEYYKKDNNIWQQYTNAMIMKTAESMAMKRAFAISGLTTREEIDDGKDLTDTDK
jgi:phage recombination protein Bet